MWKEENFLRIAGKRKYFDPSKARKIMSKILNKNVTLSEARKIYAQLEVPGERGRTLVGEAYAQQGARMGALEGQVARKALALSQRVSPDIVLGEVGDINVPISGAYAGTKDKELEDLFNKYESTAP